ncbi:hypothetical protein VP01_991g1 [Puccinia sorghi]|uniref:Uncharacterized protein n=1 Tax=Puccinia sorghi TaxID=27349 RepID=A0A0L6U5D6_9BASI|nr:hypothetical protein VP01_991g1 [Puccinia sorghi]
MVCSDPVVTTKWLETAQRVPAALLDPFLLCAFDQAKLSKGVKSGLAVQIMASSNSQSGTNSQNMGASDPQDPILASIRTMEAVREFAADIIPLRSDGTNLHAWIGEVDKTLSDLIDRDKYLQGTPAAPLNKLEDKIARNLIYWTIPRELRSCINDTPSAHDAYKALQAQFLRNNRTSHMAALVDLFNVHAEISEPQDITMLYDRMYKGMNELLASGFQVNPDTLLGALFQIAVGRSNCQLYMATISSCEVAAAARRQLEHFRSTVFDEDPIPHTTGEAMESLHVPADEDSENPNSTSRRRSPEPGKRAFKTPKSPRWIQDSPANWPAQYPSCPTCPSWTACLFGYPASLFDFPASRFDFPASRFDFPASRFGSPASRGATPHTSCTAIQHRPSSFHANQRDRSATSLQI